MMIDAPPHPIPGVSDAVSVAVGGDGTCVILRDRSVRCWSSTQQTPTEPPGLGPVTSISVGDSFGCAVRVDGTVACWGAGYDGQLGDGMTTSSDSAQPVTGLAHVAEVQCAENWACARLDDRSVWCWGYDAYGSLGSASVADPSMPTRAPLVAGSLLRVDGPGGPGRACALDGAGNATCWGYNYDGLLVSPSSGWSLPPTTIPELSGAADLTIPMGSICARRADGTVFCMANPENDLSPKATIRAPHDITGLPNVVKLSSGSGFVCVLEREGRMYCWGVNTDGVLGFLPSGGDVPMPREVTF
jgi:hypothetical protein